MRLEGVALIPTCAECGEQWLPYENGHWSHITPTMSRRTSHSSARTAPHGSSEIRRCLGAECPAPSAYESRLRRLQVIPHPPNPTVAGALAADEKHVAAANKQ